MNGKVPFPLLLFMRSLALAALLSFSVMASAPVLAADLPLAAASPLAGFAFDDRPLQLPPQRNFQMALLTAGSELGRSCGKMEAYGWRMGDTEQQRVNQIFNATVDRLRGLGYSVESQAPSSVSSDITLFTADKADKHLLFMWSAGEIGLVMVLCETPAPLETQHHTNAPSVQVFEQPNDVVAAELPNSVRSTTTRASVEHFTPVGDWIGGYTCMQGYTGGTLHITKLTGENFTGFFKFYPTPKNPGVPAGRYEVYGQYDRASHRVLINPGKWLERPRNYYNTIIVGSFDPIARSFSAYFQGINGCTSFEAKAGDEDLEALQQVHKPVKKTAKKKTHTSAAAKPAPKANSTAAAVHIVPDQPPANVASIAPAPVIAPQAPPAPTAQTAPPATMAPTSAPTVPITPTLAPAPTVPNNAPMAPPAVTAPPAIATHPVTPTAQQVPPAPTATVTHPVAPPAPLPNYVAPP